MVEIIVVLIILAILASILIPSLSGYVDKANTRAVAAEARSALLAAQTFGSEDYAESGVSYAGLSLTYSANPDEIDAITSLAELAAGSVTEVTYTGAKVTHLVYVGVKTATWNGTEWTIA